MYSRDRAAVNEAEPRVAESLVHGDHTSLIPKVSVIRRGEPVSSSNAMFLVTLQASAVVWSEKGVRCPCPFESAVIRNCGVVKRA